MFVQSFKTKITLLFIFFILIFTFIQLKNFYSREYILFSNLGEKSRIVLNDEYFNLRGEALGVKQLFINNKEYFLDENNKFDIKLYLFDGYNEFYINGMTKSNKMIKKKIEIFKK